MPPGGLEHRGHGRGQGHPVLGEGESGAGTQVHTGQQRSLEGRELRTLGHLCRGLQGLSLRRAPDGSTGPLRSLPVGGPWEGLGVGLQRTIALTPNHLCAQITWAVV